MKKKKKKKEISEIVDGKESCFKIKVVCNKCKKTFFTTFTTRKTCDDCRPIWMKKG